MKKFRGLRRRYRRIDKKLNEINLTLDEESWYNGYHIHLDRKGLTDDSIKNRRNHIKKYLQFLDKIELLTKDSKRLFQTWILVDSGFGSSDAIYFHTENPYNNFPIKFEQFDWNVEPIEFLIGLIDLQVYVLGRMYDHTGQFTYCIQKRGLGISLALLEESTDIP